MKLDQYMGSEPDARRTYSSDTVIYFSVKSFVNLLICYKMTTHFHLSKTFFKDGSLPTLGLGLSTISKPLISRAQFSCSRAAHGTVREIVWINPAMTSKGASAVSRSSLSDCRTKKSSWSLSLFMQIMGLNQINPSVVFPATNVALHIPIYPVALVQVIQFLGRGLNWADPSSASPAGSCQGTDAGGTCRPASWWTPKTAKAS